LLLWVVSEEEWWTRGGSFDNEQRWEDERLSVSPKCSQFEAMGVMAIALVLASFDWFRYILFEVQVFQGRWFFSTHSHVLSHALLSF